MSIFSTPTENDLLESEEVKEAELFANSFGAAPDRKYGWVYQYALKRSDKAEEIVTALDNKALFMLKFLGPGSGILGLVFTYLMSLNRPLPFCALIGLGLFVVSIAISMALSLAVILPSKQSWGIYIEDMLRAAGDNENEDAALAIASAGLNKSIAVMQVVVECKSSKLNLSYLVFSVSIVVLSTTILLYLFSPLLSRLSCLCPLWW